MRIGDWRVVYIIDDAHKLVRVTRIANRREVYDSSHLAIKSSPMESYARGPAFALTTQTADQAYADTARRFPDRDALVVPHQYIRLTWTQLEEEVEKTARG